ncbi:glutathione S-transferase family protein [Pseudomonas petrae]|uniref:Glutathione S-transferase family protein n=1 Tax=Pseudomonas petrae TaxID=2912190 RepID=A0ABS9I5R4_9PSED|nr:glutathione S-transferase family protein [Pseudomonas petrae]MCF7535525.1 glutathione S-transferase family protein [Pseudomonas petrae]MCF7540552.1 glutathione S-transferase family protein [Pseudomonas petrae]MCF7543117.1 glutathione S-transferase family protein [Pseudomonas petrae]MCF7558866.1 glutathione S-transferase family protein [Pseudomonas petrae]
MYKVYGDYNSGNCYKIKLMLNLLGTQYEWVPVDILKGETETEAFLAKNPNGKIPVLELEDGTCLWESNAILNFLAEGTPYLLTEPRLRTQMLQWQFFEQYSHEPTLAVARFIQFYLGLPEDRMEEYHSLHRRGNKALKVMEQQLLRTPFLVGDSFSIADIALYAYTHVADQGGFDLAQFPAIQAWLARVKQQPGYVGMLD